MNEKIKKKLLEWRYEIMDILTPSEESVDYPDFAFAVADNITKGNAEPGIVFYGNGLGNTYLANKVLGIRAALATTELPAQQGRQQGDSNVHTFGKTS